MNYLIRGPLLRALRLRGDMVICLRYANFSFLLDCYTVL